MFDSRALVEAMIATFLLSRTRGQAEDKDSKIFELEVHQDFQFIRRFHLIIYVTSEPQLLSSEL